MPKERSGFVSMAIGLVIIFLAISIAEYSAFNNLAYAPVNTNSQTANTINQTQTNPLPEMASWDSYESSKNSFSFRYPSDFTLKQEADGSLTLNVPIKDYFKTVLVNEVKLTVPVPAKTCPTAPNALATSTTVIGSPAGTFQKTMGSDVAAGNLYEESLYTLNTNGKCYAIDLLIHSANGAGLYYSDPVKIAATDEQHTADKAAFMRLVDQIVSTFTITK